MHIFTLTSSKNCRCVTLILDHYNFLSKVMPSMNCKVLSHNLTPFLLRSPSSSSTVPPNDNFVPPQRCIPGSPPDMSKPPQSYLFRILSFIGATMPPPLMLRITSFLILSLLLCPHTHLIIPISAIMLWTCTLFIDQHSTLCMRAV